MRTRDSIFPYFIIYTYQDICTFCYTVRTTITCVILIMNWNKRTFFFYISKKGENMSYSLTVSIFVDNIIVYFYIYFFLFICKRKIYENISQCNIYLNIVIISERAIKVSRKCCICSYYARVWRSSRIYLHRYMWWKILNNKISQQE